MRLKQTVCNAAKFGFHATVGTVLLLYVINVMTSENNVTSHTSRNLEEYDGNEAGPKKCQRQNEIVYIKTHKTGSCTVVNMLYRVALKYNIPVLLFKTMPYPMHGIDKYYMHAHKFLWEHVDEDIPTQFQMAAEHMRYERNNFDKVISGSPLYTTTVRRPLDHLKSVFNYFDMAGKFNIPPRYKDPAIEYIKHKDRYNINGNRKGYHIANGISNMLGLDDKDMYDDSKVEEFINNISDEFGLLMVTEYMAESFILLRRKMCWDMTDVLYVSINVRKYKGKKPVDDPEVINLHREWNNADYELYETANRTLWKTIEDIGQDFRDELELYKEYNARIADYCQPIIEKIRNKVTSIITMYQEMEPLTLAASEWGEAVNIDPVWCAAAQIDIMPFYNILRVKQFPQICNYLSNDPNLKPHMFRIYDNRKKVDMVSDFCVENLENTLVPLDILATKDIYSWS